MIRRPLARASRESVAVRATRAALAAIALLLPAASAARPDDAAVRTLDAVAIEGEVRLPQVLFISSREAERPLDVLGLWGPSDAAALAGAVPFPCAIERAPAGPASLGAPVAPGAPAVPVPTASSPAALPAPGASTTVTPPDPSTRDATQEVPR